MRARELVLAFWNPGDQAFDVIGVFAEGVWCDLAVEDERCDVRLIGRHLAPPCPPFNSGDPNQGHKPVAEGFD